ncbi:TMEM165/GDT1 family protein [Cognatiluteimonas lumbrici]|uniref:TMEM165/GDT1 family protein n=1 Tax=Cognatiluteimonas lumbrici TaxID=2559601 RepID=UPI001127C1CB|nr:TMEM165/GDT1 family protein [Luteimonas lumbrici]
MEAFLVSTGVVALAEIGDKTQLLAFVLATRFKRPLPIIAGILAATLINHALAGALGAWLMSLIDPAALRWGLGLSFLAMAAWTLVPDTLDAEKTSSLGRYGVFMTTLIAFFLAEMGDKTQLATVALAAKYTLPVAVVAGTTLGMMIANVPAVLIGDRLLKRVPMKVVQRVAAILFAVLGVATIVGAGFSFDA